MFLDGGNRFRLFLPLALGQQYSLFGRRRRCPLLTATKQFRHGHGRHNGHAIRLVWLGTLSFIGRPSVHIFTIDAATIRSTKGRLLEAFTVLFQTKRTSALASNDRGQELFVKGGGIAFQNGASCLFNGVALQGCVVTSAALAVRTTCSGRSKALTV